MEENGFFSNFTNFMVNQFWFLFLKLLIKQMIKLLLKCKADKHATNQAGSTALDVAQ